MTVGCSAMYATCMSMAPKLRDVMKERVERRQEVEDGVQCCGSLSLGTLQDTL